MWLPKGSWVLASNCTCKTCELQVKQLHSNKNPSKEMILNTFLGDTKQFEVSCLQNTVEEGLTCCPGFSLILT